MDAFESFTFYADNRPYRKGITISLEYPDWCEFEKTSLYRELMLYLCGIESRYEKTARDGRENVKREFYELDRESGCPESGFPLFPDQMKNRAEQILKALDGLRVCSALRLLDLCKDAVMQYPIKED